MVADGLTVGKLTRCRVDGDREARGWYALHELRGADGAGLLVGSYGIWRGNDNGAQKVRFYGRDQLSADARTALRKRMDADRRAAERERKRSAARAAERARSTWLRLAPDGECDYLTRKGVAAHGLRYSPSGAAAVPMLDAAGQVHGIQILRGARRGNAPAKQYWPAGVAVAGHFHLIGVPQWIVLIAEGYATGASLHEATGYPVAIAFDAGNLAPVARAIHKRWPRARMLICADNDDTRKCRACGARFALDEGVAACPHCGAEHGQRNTGIDAASAAALEVNGAWMRPAFADEAARRSAWIERAAKANDFNDLHLAEGLNAVRAQVEARRLELGWHIRAESARPSARQGGGARDRLQPIQTVDELLERFALVYGHGGTVFDHQEHMMLSISDMREACITRALHRAWAEHPDRQIVRVTDVGFDPACADPAITCNLWAGWPTQPAAGSCTRLLELMQHMCSADERPLELYIWLQKWLAYPLQRPGAKMRTTVVMHGPQGTGKNLFFEAYMAIFGPYGRVIDQAAIEDKFNDWASRKLFLIADEVVARSDLYHVKNKLKAFITGDWIRINPKNLAPYDERNHVNMVFLSNEAMPVVLEDDDRRHAVIWTPDKRGQEFYAAVRAEIAAGGIAALHDHLLNVDLSAFDEGTHPPMTSAKAELIGLSLDSTSRFYRDLAAGELGAIPMLPALATDVFELYRAWCQRIGAKAAPMPKLVNALARKHGVRSERKRYTLGYDTRGPNAVLYLGDLPDGPQTEPARLGTSIEMFRTAMRDYKGAAWQAAA